MKHKKIGFIGGGNMASAIIAGLVTRKNPQNIYVAEHNEDKCQALINDYHIQATTDYADFIKTVDIVILAVKPQGFTALLPEIKPHLNSNQLIISIAAGIPIESLETLLDTTFPIVRAMPNMPSKIGKGVTGLFANSQTTDADQSICSSIFESCGLAIWLDKEDLIGAVVALSGSSPAYFFYILEIMANIGEKLGLDYASAKEIASLTMEGSAELALENSAHLIDLRKSICSPNGTTEQAIRSFNDDNLTAIFEKAMNATVKRGKEIEDEIKQSIKEL